MQAKSGLYFGETAETPIGRLWLAVSENGLVAVEWGLTRDEFEAYLIKRFKRSVQPDPERILEPARQIDEYLSGLQRSFTLPIDWTVLRLFQQAVLQATCEIPYGETRTYKEIAGVRPPGCC